MAKRGQLRPWKVVGQWTGERPFTIAHTSRASAELEADRLRRQVDPFDRGRTCEVRVEYREPARRSS